MQAPLKDRSHTSVVIVEPSTSVRQLISDVLKELRYTKINLMATAKDALHYLEVEPVDWIILSLAPSEEVNALNLLKIFQKQPQFFTAKMSLMVDFETEKYALPLAFELGLLSYHNKVFTHNEMLEQFSAFTYHCEEANWVMPLISVRYLETFLMGEEKYSSLIQTLENFSHLYPGNLNLLLSMAKVHAKSGDSDKAIALLNQVELINPEKSKICDEIRENFKLQQPQIKPSTSSSAIGINDIIIIDPDTDVLNYSLELFSSIGVSSPKSFEDGQQAFEWLSTLDKEPDLIIMEWRIPSISGPILVQKIRRLGFLQCPIIVLSSLIAAKDLPILKEMGVDECLSKPVHKDTFFKTVVQALQQNTYPTKQQAIQIKIRRLLEAKKISQAEKFIANFVANKSIKASDKMEIDALYHFAKGQFTKARDSGFAALKQGGDNLLLFNMVGKAMLKLQQFEGALLCFEKANSFSSHNIERILNIAEASLHLEDFAHAEQALKKLQELDPKDLGAQELNTKISLENGKVDAAKSMMQDIEAGKSIVGYMNNRAISLARNDRFKEAISLYKRTLQALPPSWKALQTSVKYNLSLAFIRAEDLRSALTILEEISYFQADRIKQKVLSLKKRIKTCIKTGRDLQLSNPSSTLHNDKIRQREEVGIVQFEKVFKLSRGDMCCHLLFEDKDGHNNKAKALIKHIPRFKQRQTITKT